ncbi:MAG: cytochrome C [Chitinophagaceae bacterium]|nr:cytochrome C [Chitinophagaceae bacterium]
MKTAISVIAIFFSIAVLQACDETESKQAEARSKTEIDYVKDYIKPIPGKSDSIPVEESNRGEVLIAYSDCRSCHTVDKRFKGPAFKDIAKRYPVNNGYIELLAHRIILGGSGSWGYAVMTPHTTLSVDDARLMVKYILSLKE